MKYKCPVCGKVIGATEDIMDQQVVERFNELVNEEKIYSSNGNNGCIVDKNRRYRLCPTPRYRPYTAIEAAAQLRRKVRHKESKDVYDFYLSADWIHWASWSYSFESALGLLIFEDTGEPFGMKEG